MCLLLGYHPATAPETPNQRPQQCLLWQCSGSLIRISGAPAGTIEVALSLALPALWQQQCGVSSIGFPFPLQAAGQCAADATQSKPARLASLQDSAAFLEDIAVLSGDWARAARTVLSVAALHQQELQGWQLGRMLGAGSFGVVLKVCTWLQ